MVDTTFLKERRKSLGLTQAEAAKLAGMASHTMWARVETGARDDLRASTLVGMAKALRCSVDKLLIKD